MLACEWLCLVRVASGIVFATAVFERCEQCLRNGWRSRAEGTGEEAADLRGFAPNKMSLDE